MKLNNYIKSRMHQYFIQKLGAFSYRKGWMKSKCPYCGRDGKFGINLTQNRCNCFRCGQHPTPLKLIQFLESNDSIPEILSLLERDDYSGYMFKEEDVPEIQSNSHGISLPTGTKNLLMGKSVLARAARKYIISRGFDVNILSKKGWGYGTEGKYFGYIIIPFREKGQLSYFNARLFMGNGPKYNNPDVDSTGIGKSFIIYNIDALDIYRTVYICEGAINAETMGDNAIATGGKNISRYQINRMIKSGVERFILLLDPDAKDKAIKLGLQLAPFKKVKVVFLPDGEDVNSLGRKKTMEIIRNTPVSSYNDLLSMSMTYLK